jgi:exosome complex exonuclease DIS3/RRP44
MQNTHILFLFCRYADVCVHRLLAAAINVLPLPMDLSSKSKTHDLAANMNRRHRSAQLAGRASVKLHTLIFFAGGSAKEEDAYILDIEMAEKIEPSFTVMVPRYGIEGQVQLSIEADDPKLHRFPDDHKITYDNGTNDKITLQVFDKVRVSIWVKDVQDDQQELVIDLADPTFGSGEPKKRKIETERADDQRKKR